MHGATVKIKKIVISSRNYQKKKIKSLFSKDGALDGEDKI
jgi:hypothetical protein